MNKYDYRFCNAASIPRTNEGNKIALDQTIEGAYEITRDHASIAITNDQSIAKLISEALNAREE